MDRIDCFRAFVRALEGGSFSAAAKELGIGQPAVSKRIALLEGEFGAQLFLRTTRKLRPTPEALRIYDLARQILENFDLARASVEEVSPRPTGTLRVSVPSSFGRHYLIPIIAEYIRSHPEVRLDVRFTERFVNLVEEGIELALRIGALEFEHARGPTAGHRSAPPRRDPDLPARQTDAENAGRPLLAPLHRLFAPSGRQRMGVRIRARPACGVDQGSDPDR